MKTRGAIPALLLPTLAVACIIGIFVPNARPWRWSIFQKKAPTAQVLDAVQAQKDAQAKLDEALARQKASTTAEIGYSQQMLAGVPVALRNAPQTPEIRLATNLANRAKIGLSEAIGDLPADKQAEIEDIVGQSLSAKQEEIDAANAKLAAKDEALRQLSQEKEKLAAQIPLLTSDRDSANMKADGAIKNVVVYADNLAAKEKEAGSLTALKNNLINLLFFCGLIYAFAHFIMPCLVQEFPTSKILSTSYRWMASIFSAHSVTIPQPPLKSL